DGNPFPSIGGRGSRSVGATETLLGERVITDERSITEALSALLRAYPPRCHLLSEVSILAIAVGVPVGEPPMLAGVGCHPDHPCAVVEALGPRGGLCQLPRPGAGSGLTDASCPGEVLRGACHDRAIAKQFAGEVEGSRP